MVCDVLCMHGGMHAGGKSIWLEKSPTHAVTSRFTQALLDQGALPSEWVTQQQATSAGALHGDGDGDVPSANTSRLSRVSGHMYVLHMYMYIPTRTGRRSVS